MLFSSIPFLYYFLPLVIGLYWLAPKRLKNLVLLVSSLVFYGWGEPKYVFLMLGTVAVEYLFGLLLERYRSQRIAKLLLAVAVLLPLGALGYFKYADFFIINVNRMTGLSIPLLKIALPIGISFYTFQVISYAVDVYRGTVAAQKNPIHLATYIALFPQLIAGPIVRYSDIETQLTERKHSLEKTSVGIRRLVLGLAKKVLLANNLGELCEAFLQSGDKSVAFYWLFVLAYMLQIYFDFSGYSDMAIGLGKLFGFDFIENFKYPFVSSSITEFWRRWHISLGSWFRDYVYIPLGGNRVGRGRLLINIFVVWFLTGFWHGAEWNFAIWGLYFGVLLTVEKFFLLEWLKRHHVLSHGYTLFLVAISFAIFAGGTLTHAIELVGGMFGLGGVPLISGEWFYYLRSYGVILLIAAVAATPIPKKCVRYLNRKKAFTSWIGLLELPFLLLLLLVSTAFLVDGSFNPFLYFRF